MNETSPGRAGSPLNPLRLLGWGAVLALIALPAIAMQFTSEVNWTAADFIFAIILLGGAGLAIELAVRASDSWAYRAGAIVAVGAGLLLLWGNAAVGIIGSEDEAINLWFNLVPLVALVGAIAARFRAHGMVIAMIAAAATQIAVAAIAQSQGHFTWVFTGVWTGGWLLSAWLFRKASADSRK